MECKIWQPTLNIAYGTKGHSRLDASTCERLHVAMVKQISKSMLLASPKTHAHFVAGNVLHTNELRTQQQGQHEFVMLVTIITVTERVWRFGWYFPLRHSIKEMKRCYTASRIGDYVSLDSKSLVTESTKIGTVPRNWIVDIAKQLWFVQTSP